MRIKAQILITMSMLALTSQFNAQAAGPICSPEKLDGSGKINLSELAGDYIYVDFWASWCGPCKQSFPFLNDVTMQFEAKGITVVGINVDKNVKDATDFLKEHASNFLVATDIDGACAKAINLKGMPSSYIITKGGEVIYVHKGFRPSDIDTIKHELQTLTGKKA